MTDAERAELIAATLREAALCAKDLADGWESELVRRFRQRAIFLEREAERLKASASHEARQAADMMNSHRGAQVTDKTEAWDFRSPRAQEQPAAKDGDSGGRVAPAEFDALIAKAARAEAAEKALAEETRHCDWLRKELAGVREDVKRLIGHAETAEKALAEERAGAAVLRAALEAFSRRTCGLPCVDGCNAVSFLTELGHDACKRRADALATGAGKEWLEAARAIVVKRTWCATLARKLRELDRPLTAAAVDDLGTDIDKLARAIGREKK